MRETQVQSENSGLVRFVSNPNIQRDAVKRLVANFFVTCCPSHKDSAWSRRLEYRPEPLAFSRAFV